LSGTRWLFTPDGFRYRAENPVERARLLDEERRPSTGDARLTVDRPGHLAAHVEAPGRRILALTERFHEGWSAISAGAPLQTVRVEEDFLGCVVDPGVHDIELRFSPPSFRYGSLMTALGALLLTGIVIARLR
jgi:hypothetical protein